MKGAVRVGFLDEDKYERAKRISWYDLDKIKKAKVLIVGAGALGNEVAKDVVLAGYKKISIVDMDHVVRSNLNRCLFFSEKDAEERKLKAEVLAEKLHRMDNELKIKYEARMIQDLGEDFIPSHDIVFGCLDNIAARLHLNAHCYHNRIPYIDGGIVGFIGKVQVVLPPDTSCLECGMNSTHMRIVEMRFSCTGGDVTFFEPKLAAEITTTSIISAVQVREALKITNERRDLVINNLFYYDGSRNVSEVLEIPTNPLCPHHL